MKFTLVFLVCLASTAYAYFRHTNYHISFVKSPRNIIPGGVPCNGRGECQEGDCSYIGTYRIKMCVPEEQYGAEIAHPVLIDFALAKKDPVYSNLPMREILFRQGYGKRRTIYNRNRKGY